MLREMPSAELTEWMAYFDILQNPPPKEMSAEERANLIKKAMLGKKGKRK